MAHALRLCLLWLFLPQALPGPSVQEGKMEGVPDPGNLQLPPSLPGGTRGQHRLTQPTAGTGLRPARPRDQRSTEVAESHLRAPPPRLALQRLLPSLMNQTHPLPPGPGQNAPFPVFVSEVLYGMFLFPFPVSCLGCLCPRCDFRADNWIKSSGSCSGSE